MRKTWRRLRTLLLIQPLVLLGIFLALFFWADDATHTAIEIIGTDVLDVNVTLQDVDLSLWQRRITLRDVRIDNPPGYQSSELMHLREGTLAVNLKSLNQDTLHIRHLHLDGVDVTLEQQGLRNNLNDILNRIPKPYDPNYPETRALRIDLLEITDVVVRAKLTPLPNVRDVLTFKLAPIRMENLGHQDTLDMAVLFGKILLALSDAILAQGTNTNVFLHEANNALDRVTQMGQRLFDPNTLKGIPGLKGFFPSETQSDLSPP